MFIGHLYVFFGDRSIHILYPFFEIGFLISESSFIMPFVFLSLWNASFCPLYSCCLLSFPYIKVWEHRSWMCKSSQFMVSVLCVLFIKMLLNLEVRKQCSQILFWKVCSSASTFKSLMYLELVFFRGRSQGSSFIFFSVNTQLSFLFYRSVSPWTSIFLSCYKAV